MVGSAFGELLVGAAASTRGGWRRPAAPSNASRVGSRLSSPRSPRGLVLRAPGRDRRAGSAIGAPTACWGYARASSRPWTGRTIWSPAVVLIAVRARGEGRCAGVDRQPEHRPCGRRHGRYGPRQHHPVRGVSVSVLLLATLFSYRFVVRDVSLDLRAVTQAMQRLAAGEREARGACRRTGPTRSAISRGSSTSSRTKPFGSRRCIGSSSISRGLLVADLRQHERRAYGLRREPAGRSPGIPQVPAPLRPVASAYRYRCAVAQHPSGRLTDKGARVFAPWARISRCRGCPRWVGPAPTVRGSLPRWARRRAAPHCGAGWWHRHHSHGCHRASGDGGSVPPGPEDGGRRSAHGGYRARLPTSWAPSSAT